MKANQNPYSIAVEWIAHNPGTSSANGLAKLILSLWNSDLAYSFSECVSKFDNIRLAWAGEMLAHFLNHGEDPLLLDVGNHLSCLYPDLWEIGIAGSRAKIEAREKIKAK